MGAYGAPKTAVQRLSPFAAVLCFSLVLTPGASAQWIDYKTPGLPRTPDGKVNLKASRPTTADGKPDLTGLWALEPKIDVAGALDAAGPAAVDRRCGKNIYARTGT